MTIFALTAPFCALAKSQDPNFNERPVIANSACKTVDINHASCLQDPIISSDSTIPKMIHQLCARHNAWGTSNVFVNCVVNAVNMSAFPELMDASDKCIANNSWAMRATCLHKVLDAFDGKLD
jgi:hypothetical protein